MMKEFKGTPGPWVVGIDGYDPIDPMVIKGHGDSVSIIGFTEDINDANLIAAAPELLEALQKVSHEVGFFLMNQHPDLMYEIGLAINKALGITE